MCVGLVVVPPPAVAGAGGVPCARHHASRSEATEFAGEWRRVENRGLWSGQELFPTLAAVYAKGMALVGWRRPHLN